MSFANRVVPQSFKKSIRFALRGIEKARSRVTRGWGRRNLYDLASSERVGVVFTAPSDMRIDERLFLYAFVRGLRPARVLEIGVLNGGGGSIMANAMQENDFGQIVGLDPFPDLTVRPESLHGRYRVISKPSPDGIPEARELAGGLFDFVLVDGLHRYDQVVRDIDGLLPHLTDGAYVLFHDAFHYGVGTAIAEAVARTPGLIDCGYVCRTANPRADAKTPYNGFRLLRWASTPIVDVYQAAVPIYEHNGRTAPPLMQAMLNHDVWYCRKVEPCEQCRLERSEHLAKSSPANE